MKWDDDNDGGKKKQQQQKQKEKDGWLGARQTNTHTNTRGVCVNLYD